MRQGDFVASLGAVPPAAAAAVKQRLVALELEKGRMLTQLSGEETQPSCFHPQAALWKPIASALCRCCPRLALNLRLARGGQTLQT